MKLKNINFCLILTIIAFIFIVIGCSDQSEYDSQQPWTKPSKWENKNPILESMKAI